jgi:hypothetical protein
MLGDRLGSLADGDTESAGPLLDYVRDGRDRVTSFADRLEQGPDVVLDDIRRFARNRPMVFLACAGGLGFLAGRLVRAGSSGNGASADAQGATADATPAAGSAGFDGGPGDIALPPDVDLVAGDPTMGDVRTGSVLDAEVNGLGSAAPGRPLQERP